MLLSFPQVEYIAADGTAGSGVWVMEEVDLEAGTSVWRLANVSMDRMQSSHIVPETLMLVRSRKDTRRVQL